MDNVINLYSATDIARYANGYYRKDGYRRMIS